MLDRYLIKGRLPKEKEPPLRMELSPDELGGLLGAFDDEKAFLRYVEENRSRGRLLASPFYREGEARTFGGGLRPDGEAVGYRFERFHALKPGFLVALESGLRKSDLLALRWQDVDVENGLDPAKKLAGFRGDFAFTTSATRSAPDSRRTGSVFSHRTRPRPHIGPDE